jgi:hypothetical protein
MFRRDEIQRTMICAEEIALTAKLSNPAAPIDFVFGQIVSSGPRSAPAPRRF